MMDIKAELEHHTTWAKSVLLETNSFTPMFIIDCDMGRIPIVAQFSSDEEKVSCYKFIRLLCLAYDASAIIMLAEAWVTIVEPSGTTRDEALSATIVRKDGAEASSLHPIERDGDGNVAAVLDDLNAGATVEFGQLANLLPKGEVSDYQRNGALAALDMIVPDVNFPTVH